jgi:hypothetical protein
MKIQPGGAVSVSASTELWLSEIRAGNAFALGDVVAPVAAQNSHIQLFNPVASGKQLIVRAVILGSGTTTTLYLRRYDTALATLVGAGANLLIGGAAGVGAVRKTTNAGLLGTQILAFTVLANQPVYPVPDWFAELSPGQGILVADGSVNTTVPSCFYWREV